jgi:hypothetical protein
MRWFSCSGEAPADKLWDRLCKYGLISYVDNKYMVNVPGMMNRIAATGRPWGASVIYKKIFADYVKK